MKNSNVSNIVSLLILLITSLVCFEFRKTPICDTLPCVNVVLVGQLHKSLHKSPRENEAGDNWGQEVHILHVNV